MVKSNSLLLAIGGSRDPLEHWKSEGNDMTVTYPDVILFLSDARGQYIPRDFAETIGHEYVQNVSEDDWAILADGPDHELYWETWLDVEQNAVVVNDHGDRFTLYQDGDLWLVPEGMDYDEERGFFWPSDDEE